MSFEIFFDEKASNYLRRLSEKNKDDIKKKVKELEKFPDRGKHLRHVPFRSLRIGDYRVIYEVDSVEKKIIIMFVGHRKNVYDDFSKLF